MVQGRFELRSNAHLSDDEAVAKIGHPAPTPGNRHRQLAPTPDTDNWQLATGNWQLATGNWQLATGNWRYDTSSSAYLGRA
jgi:hypothetical protein